MKSSYDVIVIGAGSVGVPLSYFLAEMGYSVLCLDKNSSAGQGQNKAAIGGVRATHSDPAKIKICQKSLEIFSNWEEWHGKEIGWKKGGYCFPVYRVEDERLLKSMLPIQKRFDLKIDWYHAEKIEEFVPGINTEGLRGGTFSPEDGQVNPLKAIDAIEEA
ncbi:MAG TPA: FAD-binding oxidoreductase, partial [Thermoplasmata archaeon]|nr:FAD-binding oxidoreductase [Thermoplasmata archaeon]